MEFVKKIVKNNNSYYINIPINVIQYLGIEDDDLIKVTIEKIKKDEK